MLAHCGGGEVLANICDVIQAHLGCTKPTSYTPRPSARFGDYLYFKTNNNLIFHIPYLSTPMYLALTFLSESESVTAAVVLNY